ncbi:hypothetical protein QAD02_003952 [Eretmocerus hayati]|uniref:Uncharacterized protein n=1 Tax=Eretmocerus hayati TaxID=131215 RepID=A0ACC2NNK9_9HYME|nr:hypothetical protein QAD02_003952 [Eretmocerus hayati]
MRTLGLLLLLAYCSGLGVVVASGAAGTGVGDKCTNLCACKWKNGKRTVECRDRGLSSIPDDIDPETQVLDASGNRIAALTNNAFVKVRLTNLQKLYLRNCGIERVDERAFAGLSNLVELDLSHNRLTSVPSSSFGDTPFLRELNLAHNPLGRIGSNAFERTRNLVKLDLTSTRLNELAAKSFHGLEVLESLKLGHNNVSTLQRNTFEPLIKLTSIELYDNPWKCDCHLREMRTWLTKQNLPTPVAPVCREPEQLVNRSFAELGFDDFACRPVSLITSRYAEATIGENASIVCTVTAIPPARVRWIWNGKTYANDSVISPYQRILISEEGSFKKRSTLVLTNAQESDSSVFYCVAENPAGSVEANFTLHVSLRTAGMSSLGSGHIASISAALLVLILSILLVIVVLFVRMRRGGPHKLDSQQQKSPGGSLPPASGDGCSEPATQAIECNGIGGGANNGTLGRHQNTTTGISNSQLSSLGRRKVDGAATTSFSESPMTTGGLGLSPPSSSLLLLEQRATLGRQRNTGLYVDQQQPPPLRQPRYSSQVSLASGAGVDNPDLIRDTRRGSGEDEMTTTTLMSSSAEYSRLVEMDGARLLREYSECLSWSSRELLRASPYLQRAPQPLLHEPIQQPLSDPPPPAPTTAASTAASGAAMQQQQQENFPPGAKQIRVWQRTGVPVLPPVSALKRVLGSTRSSPDEGYQEGTGTDV